MHSVDPDEVTHYEAPLGLRCMYSLGDLCVKLFIQNAKCRSVFGYPNSYSIFKPANPFGVL